MPLVDVSELAFDADLANDPVVVVRRAATVNKYGEGVKSTTRIQVAAAVYPTGRNSLVREEAYQNQSKSMTVVTRFKLRPASQDGKGNQFQPDLVFWGGDYYIVKTFKDYSKYGEGMNEAECLLFNYVDTAPASIPYEGVLDFQNPSNSALVPGVIA